MIAEPDVIVIGSGFGGATAAWHLVAAGASVVLVERGPFRDTAGVRALGVDERTPFPTGPGSLRHLVRRVTGPWLPRGGLTVDAAGVYDVHLDRGMTVVSSSHVGGGSHVYFAMNERPRRADYWNGHVDEVSADGMEPHYRWMLAQIGARPSTGDGSLLQRLATADASAIDPSVPQPALGVRSGPRDEHDHGTGGADGGNVTLDTLLVGPAMARGLAVLASHECLAIARQGVRYRLTVFDHRRHRYRHVTAPRVVVAGGTLGTLRLLFHSRATRGLDGMRGLGLGFSGNADVIGLWPSRGCSDASSDNPPGIARFAVREDSGRTQLTATALTSLRHVPVPSVLRARLTRWLVLVGMGLDRGDGAVVQAGDSLRIRTDARSDRAMGEIHEAFETLARTSRRPVRASRRHPLTVHPLGGARLGRDPETSVVDARGSVHGHPGLHVADAAALPAAPGSPPSMTIAAWARHVAEGIATHG